MPVAKRASRVSVTINPNTPKKQTLEQINKLLHLRRDGPAATDAAASPISISAS